MNIIIATSNISIINELLLHLGNQYKMFSTKNIIDKAIIHEQIVGLVHTCLLALTKSALPKTEVKNMVFDMIDHHLKSYGV